MNQPKPRLGGFVWACLTVASAAAFCGLGQFGVAGILLALYFAVTFANGLYGPRKPPA